ncbi:MAG TPA: hypothetical protein VIG41_08470, partial [Micrococcaceae bacterium]
MIFAAYACADSGCEMNWQAIGTLRMPSRSGTPEADHRGRIQSRRFRGFRESGGCQPENDKKQGALTGVSGG